jgi:acyl-CoA hydrolase
MDYKELLKKKTISVEEAIDKIKDDSYIHTTGLSSEPRAFLKGLERIKGKRKNVSIHNTLNGEPYDIYTNEDFKGTINNESFFYARFCPEYHRRGLMTYIPQHLRNNGNDRFYYYESRNKPLDMYVINVTPMDKHGYFNTGPAAMTNRNLMARADLRILEINESLPRTFGDTYIHISEADFVYRGEDALCILPTREVSETDKRIGQYVADLIEDGSTLQLGIGSIPDAVATELLNKKDLGVHTEMLGDGIVKLFNAGVVTNRKKTYYPDRIVTTFTYGCQETYDFIDENVGVLHLDVGRSNSPYEIAKNDKMVSINTTLQVDLTGQCASEAFGLFQLSGIGGQTDTAVGAKMSSGGKSIIALHATAMVKNKNGERERVSKIVCAHPEGTIISLLRADVDYLVTEFGVASLRGASLRERANSLINIAHPDYRGQLREEAKRAYLL